MDFIIDQECPTGAFLEVMGAGYMSIEIDKGLCIDCGKCLQEIDCPCEAIQEV